MGWAARPAPASRGAEVSSASRSCRQAPSQRQSLGCATSFCGAELARSLRIAGESWTLCSLSLRRLLRKPGLDVLGNDAGELRSGRLEAMLGVLLPRLLDGERGYRGRATFGEVNEAPASRPPLEYDLCRDLHLSSFALSSFCLTRIISSAWRYASLAIPSSSTPCVDEPSGCAISAAIAFAAK